MKEETVSDALLRAFLLGKIDVEERDRIEILFLTDSQERERLLSAEQDLIEDYLEDNLTPEDKRKFIALYGQTREQQRTLQITKSIKDWATWETALPQASGTKISMWTRLRGRPRLKLTSIIPIAVAAMVVIVISVIWLSSRERNRRHLAIDEELAQLNTPSSLQEGLPGMVSVELPSGAVRGTEQQKEISKADDVRVVELRLPWVQRERYASYQAEVTRVGSDESFTIPKVQVETDLGYAARIRLPAQMLDRGQYQIRLSGINADGTFGLVEEYLFTVIY